ncbi:polysaccharide biosynthesis protein [Bryobacter aggregatus]|uniref:polysaccharide biosynthesis protein n=1 Tax=Bryobacter aggregatus TaxID=360054 RepID=UPI000A64E271|nr:nucleoside-diphosphate sugar epimerase/dehydratase [Bryobacter aggregatus]
MVFLNITFSRLLLLGAALLSALLFKDNFQLHDQFWWQFFQVLAVLVPVKMLLLYLHRAPHSVTHASLRDLSRTASSLVWAVAVLSLIAIFVRSVPVDLGTLLIDGIISFGLLALPAMLPRLRNELSRGATPSASASRILIYGAGSAGYRLSEEIRQEVGSRYVVAGFLDDDESLRHQSFNGIAVLGTGRQAAIVVDRARRSKKPIDQILIAMPCGNPEQIRTAVANCRAAGVNCSVLPAIDQILDGAVLLKQLRTPNAEDLLCREAVCLRDETVLNSIKGHCILVTGGAGSIGSELCRQLAGAEPSRLIIFDQSESDLHRICLELEDRFPHLDLVPELGSIRDKARIDAIFRANSVHAVFHAAAYKHVPMLENHVAQALRNNVLGTWNLAQSALSFRVPKFLMVSSDKAVRPTNVMGATKRIAELIVGAMSNEHSRFTSVRFGNVLGSNGSVIPTFQRQLEKGGPLTVTHPDVTRYFMSIPEAANLVLHAFTMGTGSEIFVLEMGRPMKIVDLAKQMIRLSGRMEGEDVQIRFIGLRPGEKMYEELSLENENVMATTHEKIRIYRNAPYPKQAMMTWIDELRLLLADEEKAICDRDLRLHMRRLVPEWQTPCGESLNVGLDQSSSLSSALVGERGKFRETALSDLLRPLEHLPH